MIGNGFHLPVVAAILLAFLEMGQRLPMPFQSKSEADLKSRLEYTIWEPGRLQTFPGLTKAPGIIQDLKLQFRDFFIRDVT